ncbi:MAG: beta-galactosidase [Thermoguttaceae bacterium]|nr:beta-galactosidase [Thermoguttaceae bacterium]
MNSRKITRRAFGQHALLASALFGAETLAPSSPFAQFNAETTFGAEPASSKPGIADSPYGVCSHLGGGEEHDQMPKNLELMKAAGIAWARADFSWSGVERRKGEWTFDHLDRVVEETSRAGIQILPILDYDVAWATPAFQHLDAWLEYVRRTVERYRDRIRYWEVWNEPNLEGFWKAKPSGADYATLLRETYKTIKAIDPELVVLYGGLAGVPIDYFEASLDAGAGEFFDVVNIHPYRGGLTTEQTINRFEKEIAQFSDALKKRNIAPKPTWITEMGWATPPVFGETNNRVVTAGLQHLFPKSVDGSEPLPKVAIFYDSRYEPAGNATPQEFYRLLPAGYFARGRGRDRLGGGGGVENLVSFVDADELTTLSPKDVPALIMPPSETFPADRFDAMVKYVKDGGALFLLGGVPLYYRSIIDETGAYQKQNGNPTMNADHAALRISWFAWWTRENVPEEAPLFVASASAKQLEGYQPVVKGTRFFDDSRLKDGDRFIPLLEAKKDDFTGVSACVYDFNSDYCGAVVVSSILGDGAVGDNVSTVENQAVYLPQALLAAFAFGVERYFWYEFHAPQRDDVDKEHHFGIVGQELDPKPGYFAYQALTKARPAGSTGDRLDATRETRIASWTRPDGKRGWAIWSSKAERPTTVKLDGKVDAAFDYLGNEIAKPTNGAEIRLSPGLLYLVGPKNVELN